MKNKVSLLLVLFITALGSLNAQDTSNLENNSESELLGLPGDNLDLYTVLDLFQKSKTIEDFEKSLNDEETGVNNLDLNLDEKVDFIKVVSKQNKNDFVFVLQVDVLKDEIQDVASILVSKDKNEKVTMQIVGNEDLYGKDYVIEPKLETPSITANPGYTGTDTVAVENQEAEVVVIESEPIIRYVYSPMYIPYYPPYYYGYYPPYYRPYPVVHISFYYNSHRYHHNNYYGGHHNHGRNVVVINNNKTYNNYSKKSHSSKTVYNNKNNGNYKSKNYSNKTTTANKKNNTSKATKSNNKKNSVKKNNTNVKQNRSNVTRPTSRPANVPSRVRIKR